MSANTTSYTVAGMTCNGCARKVSAAVDQVPGVTEVAVDVAAGRLTVTGDRPIGAELVRDAVEDAGYEVTS